MKTRIKIIITFTLVLLTLKFSYGKLDPDIQWLTLETAHFSVITPKKLIEVGKHYAYEAERAYTKVSTVFSQLPQKTVLVIDDSTDAANGFATRIPYPTIHIYPVIPKPLTSIGFYSNWSLELLIHEFTHIATFEPADGVSRPVRWLFGSIITPNMLLPRWWLEGIAVTTESQLSPAGRLRSPYTKGLIRGLIEDKLLTENTLDIINEGFTPTWPSGRRPYLLGGILMNSIDEARPKSSLLNQLTQKHSARIPYLSINTPIKTLTGLSYSQSLKKAYAQLEKKFEQEQNTSDTPKRHLLLKKYTSYSQIKISPDKLKISFIVKDRFSNTFVQLIQRSHANSPFDFKTAKTIFKGDNISHTNWHPSSQSIIFNQITQQDKYYFFSDIYEFHISSNKKKRLTNKRRTSEFTISPNGLSIVYVSYQANNTYLKLMTLSEDKSLKHETLLIPPSGTRLSSPVFTKENEVLFIEKISEQTSSLKKITLDNKVVIPISIPIAQIHTLKKSSNGFIASSSQSGILNLYKISQNLKNIYPLTQESTGAISGDLDTHSHSLYFSRFTGTGIHLFQKNKEHIAKIPLRLPVNSPIISQPTPKIIKETSREDIIISEKPYSPLKYLIPHYWVPFIYPIDQGILLQITTSSKDPLDKHQYSLQGGWDSYLKKTNLGFQYLNQTFPSSFQLNYSQFFDRLIGSQNPYQSQTGQFLIEIFSNQKHQLRGGWSFHNRLTSSLSVKRSGPSLSYSYTNISTKPETPSSLYGNSFNLSYVDYLSKYSDISYKQVLIFAQQYFSHFSLKLRGLHQPKSISPAYGVTTSNAPYQASLISKDFLMRGYPYSEFLFRSGLNPSIEYYLPIKDIYKGNRNTLPLFLKKIHANFFIDALMMDGFFYSKKQKTYLKAPSSKWFYSTGLELNLDTTIGYHLPVTFFWGLYHGFNKEAQGSLDTFIGIKL